MSKNFKFFLFTIIIFYLFLFPVFSQDFEYEHWPGKNGEIKYNIRLPLETFTKFETEIAEGSNKRSIFYKIPLSKKDVLKKGRLEVNVYNTIKEAQSSLRNFLYTLQTPFKPPRLSSEELNVGDVVFGVNNEKIFLVCFTRNNVRIIIEAPIDVAKKLSYKIDEAIQNSPNWKPGDQKPAVVDLK